MHIYELEFGIERFIWLCLCYVCPIPNLVLGIHYYNDLILKKFGAKDFTLKNNCAQH